MYNQANKLYTQEMTPIPSYVTNGGFHYPEQAIVGVSLYLRGVLLGLTSQLLNEDIETAIQYAIEKNDAIESGHIVMQLTIPYDPRKYLTNGDLNGSILSLTGYAPVNVPPCTFPPCPIPGNLQFPVPSIPIEIDSCERFLVWIFQKYNLSLIEGAQQGIYAPDSPDADLSREVSVTVVDSEAVILLTARMPIDWKKWLKFAFLPICPYRVAIIPV